MAVPTLSSITPNLGHSGGQTLVAIVGTGFALPPTPSATGLTTAPPDSVTVLIGGRVATRVAVVSATLIYCLTPKGDPGAVTLSVQNNDADGVAVGGELASLPTAFTFARPDLSEESELARVVRAFMRELKRQIHPNVNFATHTDYDAETGDTLNLADVGSLPAIVLANLDIPEDRVHAVQAPQDFEADAGRFIERRPPVAVEVHFTLVGVSNDPVEILNLMQVTRMFFKKNPWLELDRDVADASLGTVRYELDFSFGGPVSVTHQSEGNVESFGGAVVIRGVILEDMPGISRAKPPGIPTKYPHEATTGYGWTTLDDPGAVTIQPAQPKDDT